MQSKRLEKLPKTALFNKYIWVDYFELRCLMNIDKCITFSDIFDKLHLESQDIDEPYDDDIGDTASSLLNQNFYGREEKTEQRATGAQQRFVPLKRE
jgi:hypothetical protein